MVVNYHYDMGIMVGNVRIPDPSEWSYEVGDLDTEGARDATGYLHRAMVAQKINYEFKWQGMDWEMLEQILAAVDSDKFSLTAPNPKRFNQQYTGDYYVGDRKGKSYYYWLHMQGISLFDLSLKFIEY